MNDQQSQTSDLSTARTESWFERLLNKLNFFTSKDDVPADADADEDANASGDNDNQDANADNNSSAGQGAVSELPYVVSVVHQNNERFARYYVVTGSVQDVSSFFNMKNVEIYPQDGSIYVRLLNNATSSAQIYNCIRQLNLTMQMNPKGLPDVDENAPEILLMILPK